MSLEGKTVLVTGGAGPDLGSTMVRMFRAEGARVVAADVDEVRLAALKQELPDVVTVVSDASTADGCDAAMDAAGDDLYVLCNHAGGGEVAPIEEVTQEHWDFILALNLTAAFRTCKRAVPKMVERGGGVIVNTVSVAGLRGGRSGPAYAASKWGLVGLTQNIAATYGHLGIRSNAICPGPMGNKPNATEAPNLSARGLEMLTRDRDKPERCPPELIASVAVFLARDEGARINGAAIPVDGGWIAF